MILYLILVIAILIGILAILSFHQDIKLSECTNNQTLLSICVLQFISALITLYCIFGPNTYAIYCVCLLQLTALILLFTRFSAIEDGHRISIVGDTRTQKIVHWFMLVFTFIVLVLCAWKIRQRQDVTPTVQKDPSVRQRVVETVQTYVPPVLSAVGQGVKTAGQGVVFVAPSVLSTLGTIGRVAGKAVIDYGPSVASSIGKGIGKGGSFLYSRFVPDQSACTQSTNQDQDSEKPLDVQPSVASLEIQTNPHCKKYYKDDGKPSCTRVNELGTNDKDCKRKVDGGCQILNKK